MFFEFRKFCYTEKCSWTAGSMLTALVFHHTFHQRTWTTSKPLGRALLGGDREVSAEPGLKEHFLLRASSSLLLTGTVELDQYCYSNRKVSGNKQTSQFQNDRDLQIPRLEVKPVGLWAAQGLTCACLLPPPPGRPAGSIHKPVPGGHHQGPKDHFLLG